MNRTGCCYWPAFTFMPVGIGGFFLLMFSIGLDYMSGIKMRTAKQIVKLNSGLP
jgi:hypothetical protein